MLVYITPLIKLPSPHLWSLTQFEWLAAALNQKILLLIHSLLSCSSSTLTIALYFLVSNNLYSHSSLSPIQSGFLCFLKLFSQFFSWLSASNWQQTGAVTDLFSAQSCASRFFFLGCPLSPFTMPEAAVRPTPSSLFLLCVPNSETQECKAPWGLTLPDTNLLATGPLFSSGNSAQH